MVEIIIGDSYEFSATFYEPATSSTPENPVPDTENPIDLTNVTVTLVITADNRTETFDDTFVTVTPLAGKVDVLVTATETEKFARCKTGKRYLNFDYGQGRVISKLWEDVTFVPKKYE
ncbi:MAG TPA: hypothetical protein PLX39_15520 [Pyrinomonadaceae bacterium]|nr:hypothetical protein [Pyrinomonadaceae bacterium]